MRTRYISRNKVTILKTSYQELGKLETVERHLYFIYFFIFYFFYFFDHHRFYSESLRKPSASVCDKILLAFYCKNIFPSKYHFSSPILTPIINKFDGLDIKHLIFFSSSFEKKIMFLLIFKERSSRHFPCGDCFG